MLLIDDLLKDIQKPLIVQRQGKRQDEAVFKQEKKQIE